MNEMPSNFDLEERSFQTLWVQMMNTILEEEKKKNETKKKYDVKHHHLIKTVISESE